MIFNINSTRGHTGSLLVCTISDRQGHLCPGWLRWRAILVDIKRFNLLFSLHYEVDSLVSDNCFVQVLQSPRYLVMKHLCVPVSIAVTVSHALLVNTRERAFRSSLTRSRLQLIKWPTDNCRIRNHSRADVVISYRPQNLAHRVSVSAPGQQWSQCGDCVEPTAYDFAFIHKKATAARWSPSSAKTD